MGPVKRKAWTWGLVLVVSTAACKHDFEPPDRTERVAAAAEQLTPALFDTVQWTSEEARLLEGSATYAAKCRRCHGTFGAGDTDYARQRHLELPSLVTPDWHWADSLTAVRNLVFTGHEAGMPTWGVAGISAREIDAASYYLLTRLRPEVIGRGTGG